MPCVSLLYYCQLPEQTHSLKECMQWVGTWWQHKNMLKQKRLHKAQHTASIYEIRRVLKEKRKVTHGQ